MDARRVEHNRNRISFNRINRRVLNQSLYPPIQPLSPVQYEVPRPLDEGTWRRPHKKPLTTQLAQKIRRPRFKLYTWICNNRYKILSLLIQALIATSSIGFGLFQVMTLIMKDNERTGESSLQIVEPTTAKIPAVSICFEYKIDEEKMRDAIEARKKVTASKLTDPTVGMIINTTPGVDDLVDSCVILNHLNVPVPCSQMSTVRQAIVRNLKCFTWFSHGSWQSKNNNTPPEYRIRLDKEWVLIKLKNLSTIEGDTIGISIHENHVPVQANLADPQFIEVCRSWYPDSMLSKVTLTWRLDKLVKLPAQKPHARGCINYKETQETVEQILLKSNDYDVSVLSSFDRSSPVILQTWFTTVYASRRELIDSCIGYFYATQYHDHWPSNLLAQERKQGNFILDYRTRRNLSTHRESRPSERFLETNNYRLLCRRLFRYPECEKTTHSIRILTNKYENRPDNMDIALYVPTDIQKHLVEMPIYESGELVAISSSHWAFWIGIPVVKVAVLFLPMLFSLYIKLKGKNQQVLFGQADRSCNNFLTTAQVNDTNEQQKKKKKRHSL